MMSSRNHPPVTLFLFFAGLCLGMYFFTLRITGFGLEYFAGDLGDGRLNMYFLEHAHRWFTGQNSSFWDAPFMYPQPAVITYSDNLLGSAPLYSLFRLLGFETFTSYQLWFVVVSALNYGAAFLLLKKITGNTWAAVLGAMVFAFSISLQSQLTHAQTFPRFAIPLAFWGAVRFRETLRPADLFLSLFFLVYQFWCGIYLGFMLAVPLGIFLLLIIASRFSQLCKLARRVQWSLKILATGMINILLLLPLVIPYKAASTPASMDHYRYIFPSIPGIRSHFFSQHGSLLWDFMQGTGSHYPAWWDHQIFAGAIATLAMGVAAVLLFRKLWKVQFKIGELQAPWLLLLAGLLTFPLFVRVGSHSGYLLVYFLPGFNALRSITRIINIELIFFATATAVATALLIPRSRWQAPLVFSMLMTLLIVDNYHHPAHSYRTSVESARERTLQLQDVFARIPQQAIVSYEPHQMQGLPLYYQIDAMLLGQQYNHKIVNAYTGGCPAAFGHYWHRLDEESRNIWLNSRNHAIDTLYVVKSAAELLRLVPEADLVSGSAKD